MQVTRGDDPGRGNTHDRANRRFHGSPPRRVVVVHGGPGAAGEMAPVARELARDRGVLEPFQTAITLEGQVEELQRTSEDAASPPVDLIGYSWGAWLSTITAARSPSLVRRLILVSSGPFEGRYAEALQRTGMSRLSAAEASEWRAIVEALNTAGETDKDALLQRLGALSEKADAFDAILDEPETAAPVRARAEIFQQVWAEAAELRRSGALLAFVRQVACPVVALHGDHDPHLAYGVREPLEAALREFRFLLLLRCGHTPWRERHARAEFFRALRRELDR